MNKLTEQKNILILGIGISTKAAIAFLANNNHIYIYGENLNDETFSGVVYIKSKSELAKTNIDYCIKSPGMPYHQKEVIDVCSLNIPIFSDVEVFLSESVGKVIAVTGSNGKTTVATMIFELLKTTYSDVRLCGNVGVPVAQVVENVTQETIFVVELSSFQLKAINKFRADVSVILNLQPSHIDYHETVDDYYSSKLNLLNNVTDSDIVIINSDDENLSLEFAKKLAQAERISLRSISKAAGSYGTFDNNALYIENKKVIDRVDISVPGEHNVYNALMAISAVSSFNIPSSEIKEIFQKFFGVKHRLQEVAKVNGVSIYNDSKSTNEFAALSALAAFEKSDVIWIAGGFDRKTPLSLLNEKNTKQVKKIICIGQNKEMYYEFAQTYDIEAQLSSIETCLVDALESATEGDVVLFSPGSASYDSFTNFEDRGEFFIQCVKERIGDKS